MFDNERQEFVRMVSDDWENVMATNDNLRMYILYQILVHDKVIDLIHK